MQLGPRFSAKTVGAKPALYYTCSTAARQGKTDCKGRALDQLDGMVVERIKPGHPQQNGRHERMHLTLKKETTKPAGMNSLQQQARFDAFVEEFNTERPHEALGMKRPADVYSASPRPYAGLPDLTYPLHDRDVLVTSCGRICMHRKKINVSLVLAGQRLGIKEVDEGIWLVSFMHYDLGFIDLEQRTLQPLDNPFGPRLSPMS